MFDEITQKKLQNLTYFCNMKMHVVFFSFFLSCYFRYLKFEFSCSVYLLNFLVNKIKEWEFKFFSVILYPIFIHTLLFIAAFDLNYDDSILSRIYLTNLDKEKQELFRQMSEQLACLWSLMKENPNILIQKDSQLVLELSYNIKKEFNKSMEKVEIADNSYLLILERSMDMKSPLMYDLSFQVVLNFFNSSKCFDEF